ncbi:hypothetical protein E4U22_002568, partial [Claviceps purpurea]
LQEKEWRIRKSEKRKEKQFREYKKLEGTLRQLFEKKEIKVQEIETVSKKIEAALKDKEMEVQKKDIELEEKDIDLDNRMSR